MTTAVLDAAATLRDATRHHQAGRLEQAERGYREILEAEPGHPAAAGQLAMIHAQRGRWDLAETLLRQAADAAPGEAMPLYNLGLVLQNTGRPAEAEESYRAALQRDPALAEADVNLGILLLGRRRLAEAEACFRRAVAARDGFAFAHVNLGLALYEQGRHEEALESCTRAAALMPALPAAHHNRALALLALGRADEAEHAVRRALAAGAEARTHNTLGMVLERLGKPAEALAAYGAALRMDPGLAAAHANRGALLRQRGEWTDAEAALRRALELDPGLAEAHNNLGVLLHETGDPDAAAGAFRRAVDLRPGYADALYHLSASARLGADDPAVADMERAWRHPGTPAAAREALAFALGNAYRRQGRWDDAFARYAEGNRLRRAELDYDPAADEEEVRRIERAFPAPPTGWRGGADSPLPVFVVGMPRTGKTLVEALLATLPGVHAGRELTALPEIAAGLSVPGRGGRTGPPECVPHLSPDQARRAGEAYVARLRARAPGAARATDTLPGNAFHVGLIRRVLPNARIVHCARDAMDACVQAYFTRFATGQRHSFHLEELGRYCRLHARMMAHWHRVFPGALLEVRYEEMVRDPAGTRARLATFCGLPAPREADAAPLPALRADEIGEWRRYEAHLGPLARALAASDE